MSPVLDRLAAIRLMPIVIIDKADDARPLAAALKAGGLLAAEVTFRTDAAEAAIRAIAEDKDICLGAGTILKPDQVDRAVAAGAAYIVSPGFDAKVVRRCRELGVPSFPGVATPTEIQMAMDEGVDVVKFFPAEAIGGVKALKAMAAPFGSMRFIPTGGISLAQLPEYLAMKSVVAVGGSFMVAPELLKTKNWAEVTRLSAASVAVVKGA